VAVSGGILGYDGEDDDGPEPLTLEDLQAHLPSPPVEVESPNRDGGYGPDRPILDLSHPDDRQGFSDGPHFNSYINTEYYGDERAFLDAKPASIEAPGGFEDELQDVSGRYRARVYVENGGVEDDSLAKVMTARNTRVRFEIPNGRVNGVTVQARITADNAIPPEIYDTVTFRNESQSFHLDFISGSAILYNNAHPEGIPLSDSIVREGVLIGYEELDGFIRPGYQYAAFVVIEINATPSR
jgi:hypothetical protein